MKLLIFLSSGLFLGWSLGANDASNVFGTAVATKMIRFKTAAIICSIFVILGACISGAGAAHTLGKLGAVNTLAGAFMVCCAAAFTVFWMTKLELPVSTSQAIVGAIIGWNFFSGSLTDYNSLGKIVSTWVLCPILSAIFSIIFFKIISIILKKAKIHLFRIDAYTRAGLIIVGAFGAYSLGANNIANVMGVFIPSSPFKPINFICCELSSTQQLFLLGGIAISIGIFTYSYRVMVTVGKRVVKLTPQAGLIVVLSEAIVLFLFASESLEEWLISHGLPSIPLVPVSSSQAVIGAVVGIGIAKGARNIQWKVLGKIAVGWITTPIIAGIISFFSLFFLQNVFQQEVYKPTYYKINDKIIEKIKDKGVNINLIKDLKGKIFKNSISFYNELKKRKLNSKEIKIILKYAEIYKIKINKYLLEKKITPPQFSSKEINTLKKLIGKEFKHKWELYEKLIKIDKNWQFKPNNIINRKYNRNLKNKLNYIYRIFRID